MKTHYLFNAFYCVTLSLILNVSSAQTFTFTNAGASGNEGPTQAQLNTSYTGTNLAGQVTSNAGIQLWAAPFSGNYKIEAWGAQGANATTSGGLGAYVSGEFSLTAGDTLQILVGQQGDPGSGSRSGGGGGSFVVKHDANPTNLTNNDILLIAGGGGSVLPVVNANAHGTVNQSGNPSGFNGSNPGTNGNGGTITTSHYMSTGSGFFTDGQTGTTGNILEAKAYINGGVGSYNTSAQDFHYGGFGGGGGARGTATTGRNGGGGGYSGGAAGEDYGSGGGSYNSGINQSNSSGVRAGDGLVIIEALTIPAPNDAGISIINNPGDSVFCDTPENIELTIRNHGLDVLDSAVVHVIINNDTLPPFPFYGPLDTLNGSGPSSQQITTTNYSFNQTGYYDIVAYTTMPNGQPDTVNLNDTAKKTIFVKLMDLQTTSVTEPLCHGDPTGTISVTSTAVNPTYLWFHGPTGDVATGLTGGTYTVVVTGDFSCPDTLEVNIHEPDPLAYDLIEGGSVSCHGDTDGFLEIEGTGGTPPYTYNWISGQTGNTINNVPPGNYGLIITDDNNCDQQFAISISEPGEIIIDELTLEDASCFGYHDAQIQLDVSGGTPPFNYSWSNNATTSHLTNLAGGQNYKVTVVDSSNCEAVKTYTIEQPVQLDTSLTNRFKGELIANHTPGNAIYQWWDCDLNQIISGETNNRLEPSANGTYAMIISIDDCQDTSNCHTLKRVSTGDLTNEVNDFTIYPNPNNGLFNVRFTGNGNDAVQMQIVDMQGKVLTDKKLGRIEGELVEEVNLNLAAGVYFVKVISDGNLSVKRVVVQ